MVIFSQAGSSRADRAFGRCCFGAVLLRREPEKLNHFLLRRLPERSAENSVIDFDQGVGYTKSKQKKRFIKEALSWKIIYWDWITAARW